MPIRVNGVSAPAPKKPTTPRSRSALLPAAATGGARRTATALTERELGLSGDAIETFAAAVGGRKKLLETLAVADSDSGNDKVVNCLLDPQYSSWSLRRICAYAGITVAELFASYKKALLVAAHIEATHLIASKLPPIVDDVMTRAVPVPMPCPRCGGQPIPSDPGDCPLCQGIGQVLSEPDLDRQKLALELGRLTNQHRGGVVVQQNVAANTAAVLAQGTGSLEQLQQAVGDLLFAPGRRRAAAPAATIEAAVIDPREPPTEQRDPPGLRDVPLPFDDPAVDADEPSDDAEEDQTDGDDTLTT